MQIRRQLENIETHCSQLMPTSDDIRHITINLPLHVASSYNHIKN